MAQTVLYHNFIISPAPPTVSANGPSSQLIGLIGFNITISFSISAAPLVTPSDIEWRFQGSSDEETEIMPTARYTFSDDKLSLTIYNIHEADEGQFTLRATNELGQDQASIQLVVDG